MADDKPVIVFGAFDRHNFGDLLFAHVAAELLKPRPAIFAGLAERDLTAYGGHRVRAIAELAREWGDRPADLVHAGGEILTCSLYEAAVMLLTPEAAQAATDGHDPAGQDAWAQAQTGLRQAIGYLVPKQLFQRPGRFIFTGVGGAGMAHLSAARQAEVLANLRQADHVTVRDRLSQSFLEGHGLRASLVPDPAVLTARLFASIVAAHQSTGEPRAVSEHFHQGYVAVQFSADFGDDATLQRLSRQLDEIAATTGMGLVLFRAGAAPWHDDLGVYRRLHGFMASDSVSIFESLQLWDICALLAGARAYCGSSLHGRIVAEAFAIPAVSLLQEETGPAKQAAYAGTWAIPGQDGLARVGNLADELQAAMAVAADLRRRHSAMLAARALAAAQAWQACLNAPAGN